MTYQLECSRCRQEITHRCNSDFQQTLKDLLKWRPEIGFPKQPIGTLDTLADGSLEVDQPDMPFLTEAYLYPLLGKEDARTLLSLISTLAASQGIDINRLRVEAREEIKNRA